MDLMTQLQTELRHKRNIRSRINSIRVNQMAKIRYAQEKAQSKNRIVQLFQIS